MELQAYFDRIGFAGEARPDLETLRRVQRLHLETIPYENLDVALRRPVSLDVGDILAKIVERRRGGWCYEMNGLLGWALERIGFKVTRMAGGVMRAVRGDDAIGNHLVLRVDLDRPYLADAGFGDGMVEPAPIEAHAFRQSIFDFRLEDLGQGWWRFHNQPSGGAPSFDFEMKPAPAAVLAERCAWLQSSPDSPFVQNAVVQRHFPDRLEMMRGRVLKTVTRSGVASREIGDAGDYVTTLAGVFGLDLPEAEQLWPAIVARHNALFGAQAHG